MKRCLFYIAILLLLQACDQVIFPEPQPGKVKPLSEIPSVLQGDYLDQDGDTLNISEHSFSYYSEEVRSFKNVYLSDSSVLKKYYGHYFYNTMILVGDEAFWLTYILSLKEDGSGLDLYAMDPDNVVNLAKLQEITSKIRDVESDQTYYLFNPKRRDYKKIISDTIFSKMISFERVGD